MGIEPDIMFAGQLESKSAGQETPELFNVCIFFIYSVVCLCFQIIVEM